MTDTPTPPPAASDAIEAALDEWYRIRTHNNRRPTEHECMRAAIAAYHAALPSEFGALKKLLAMNKHVPICVEALAAITALEARLAGAYERCATIAESACLVPPDGGSPTRGETDVAEAAASAIRALAAKGE
jgi:hypothetical protein